MCHDKCWVRPEAKSSDLRRQAYLLGSHWTAVEPDLRRDGLLAGTALVILVGLALATGRADVLTRPTLAVIGVLGSLGMEAFLLRYHTRTRALWNRPVVQLLAIALVAAAGIVAVRVDSRWILAVLVWGLITYLTLLTALAVGFGKAAVRLTK